MAVQFDNSMTRSYSNHKTYYIWSYHFPLCLSCNLKTLVAKRQGREVVIVSTPLWKWILEDQAILPLSGLWSWWVRPDLRMGSSLSNLGKSPCFGVVDLEFASMLAPGINKKCKINGLIINFPYSWQNVFSWKHVLTKQCKPVKLMARIKLFYTAQYLINTTRLHTVLED